MATPAPRLKPRRSIDWRQVARLWAAGTDFAAMASRMGIDEDRFWRHYERSSRFRRFLKIALAERPMAVDLVNLVSDKPRISSG